MDTTTIDAATDNSADCGDPIDQILRTYYGGLLADEGVPAPMIRMCLTTIPAAQRDGETEE